MTTAKGHLAANDGIVLNPSAIAREALRQLAEVRLPPTPDNFAKAYHDLSTSSRSPEAGGALAVLRDIADHLTDAVHDRSGAGAAPSRRARRARRGATARRARPDRPGGRRRAA